MCKSECELGQCMFNVCKVISHKNICVPLKHKHKSTSTTARTFPMSHRFCFLQRRGAFVPQPIRGKGLLFTCGVRKGRRVPSMDLAHATLTAVETAI